MQKALINIDVQNDYFQSGRNELVHTRKATLNGYFAHICKTQDLLNKR